MDPPDLARAAGADDLAARRRPVHHAAARVHRRPADAPAERRDVPRAGLRRAHGRNALAAAQAGPRARRRSGARRIPVAIAIGGDPALTYAATAPLPPIVDELAFAGLPARHAGAHRQGAAPSISTSRPMPTSSSRARSTTTTCASRGRSATTPACIQRRRSLSDACTSPRSRTAATRSAARPSSASRRWKTRGSAKRPSGSFCRCFRWSSQRSSTTTCRSRAAFTTW